MGALCGGALLAWPLLPSPGWGAEPASEPAPVFEAMRTLAPPDIDGRLDERVWAEAPVFSDFHQSFPNPGAQPGERTEVRILYDDANLYVGIRCFDHSPHAINAQLGRRDDLPDSDSVEVMIDSLHDRRTAISFAINAGGTLADALITQDTAKVSTWDGAWQGSATRDDEGWSAELRIPLRLLHFPRADEQRWGFHVRRKLARTHERLDSVPLPPDSNALVSRFAELRSLRNLEPPRHLTLTPYIGTRLVRPPLPQSGGPRVLEPSVDVGVDLQAGLTSDLSLTLTLNPDFGQEEVDPLLVNLATTERFFQEKRSFFMEGLELFAPVVDESLPEQFIFYSRRIGLEPELPLLAAVKLSGTVREGVQVSLLDAVVSGAAAPLEVPPDRRIRFHPGRPLHFAPNASLPTEVPAPRNILAGVTRVQVSPGATVGAMAALSTPATGECRVVDSESGVCEPRGGGAAAADASLRSPSGDYTLEAQLIGSRVTGGPAAGVVLRDGTLLRRGDTGYGVQLSGGKPGGEPWRMHVAYSHASPRLELNPTGYQRTQNDQELLLRPEFVRTQWKGFPFFSVGLEGILRWSTNERVIPLGRKLALMGSLLLPSSASIGCATSLEWERKDLREIIGAGIAFQRPSLLGLSCGFSSDPSRALSLLASVNMEHAMGASVSPWLTGQSLSLDTTWKPMPRLRTSLSASVQNMWEGPRWLEEQEDSLHRFGDQTSRILSLSLSQLVVLSPTLSLNTQAQVLSGYLLYDRFYEARVESGAVLRLDDLSRITPTEDPSSPFAQFRLNLVLRWDYALGSTFYIVYTRDQQALPPSGDEPARLTLLPRGLLGGVHTDSLLMKLGYMW